MWPPGLGRELFLGWVSPLEMPALELAPVVMPMTTSDSESPVSNHLLPYGALDLHNAARAIQHPRPHTITQRAAHGMNVVNVPRVLWRTNVISVGPHKQD